jgi:DNA polymerase III delta prime subunit
MNNNEITIIKANIQAQLDRASVAPICIAGVPGTGKSTTIELLANDLDMNIVTESAPCLTHEILSGLPDTVDASNYQANSIDGSIPKATVWSIPEMVARAIRAAKEKSTVLLIDDFHMVSPHLQAYFYGLLLERRLGNYKLSDNIAIILTMNDSESAGFNGINSAVRNRMSVLKVEFNFDYWLESYGNRLHYMVSSFLKTKPQYCMEDETTGIVGYATARAWTAIANELKYYSDDFILAQASIIAGMQVSQEAARAFQTHVNYIAAIDFSKVVASRELVDLSKKDPLDSIIYSYITNFINTVDDGFYLFELMNTNINQSAFVGFILGELYVKYTNQDSAPLSEGLTFVIDRLLSNPGLPSNYPNTSKKKIEESFNTPIDNLDIYMKKTSEYLL